MHLGKPGLNLRTRGQGYIDGSSIWICLECLVSPVVISTK